MGACMNSTDCEEVAWTASTKQCYPSKKPQVVFQQSGSVHIAQCVELSDDQISTGENKNGNSTAIKLLKEQSKEREVANAEKAEEKKGEQEMLKQLKQEKQEAKKEEQVEAAKTNRTQTEAKVDPAQEIEKEILAKTKGDTPQQAKQQAEEAKDRADQVKQEVEDEKEELKDEKKQKAKIKDKAEKDKGLVKVLAENESNAPNAADKKKTKAALEEMKERTHKESEKAKALAKEGAEKKEKKFKLEEKLKKMTAFERGMFEQAKVAKLANEKRIKSNRWYKKGHILFAQGIKYQNLLEKLSQSDNKIDAYHYRKELSTYTAAFPSGFTAPLHKGDGFIGKSTPAGNSGK